MITDGVIDRDGVAGLARSLFVSERHLSRVLTEELGAGPLAIARAQRTQTARVLIETTDLAFGVIAFAAGFASIRQFNDSVTEVFASTPTDLRRATKKGGTAPSQNGRVSVRLPFRSPIDLDAIFAFLKGRAVNGVEFVGDQAYTRSLRLPNGTGIVTIKPGDGYIVAAFQLTATKDLGAATARVRRLFDLDADSEMIVGHLSADPRLVRAASDVAGLRVPGSVDPHEVAIRAVLGQQVSVAAARTIASRLAEQVSETVGAAALDHSAQPDHTGPKGSEVAPTLLFPSSDAIAALNPDELPMPRRRAASVVALADALASGKVQLDLGVDREAVRKCLEALPGIGPWTSGYIAMRGLSDPDVCLHSDLVALNGARNLGIATTSDELAKESLQWSPWRSYATHLLWAAAHPQKVAPQ